MKEIIVKTGRKHCIAMRIETFNTGETLLKALKAREFDIIFLDIDLITISGVEIKSGEYEEAESYIQNCYDVLCSSENKVNSGNIVIDSIINSKYQEANNCGVSILCDVKVPEYLNIASFDLSAILYNLLENAMGAVLEMEHDRVIELIIELDRGILYISIKNRYTGEIVYQGGKIVTKSSDLLNHGYGLESIRTAINKYDGNMRIKHDEGLFEVMIMLYNKKYVE